MKPTVLLLSLLTGLASLSACGEADNKGQGSQGRGQGPVRAACEAEIKKHCTGEERAGQCLRNTLSELSEGCKAALATRGQQR